MAAKKLSAGFTRNPGLRGSVAPRVPAVVGGDSLPRRGHIPQSRVASPARAHPGCGGNRVHRLPQRGCTRRAPNTVSPCVWNPFRVRPGHCTVAQGGAAAPLTLGCGVQPLAG